MFETVKFTGDLPRWDLSINPNRTQGLRRTLEGHHQWPLEKLVAMHAGDVVQLPGDRIEAFYSQDWAFARFLWEYKDGKYRPAFKKLLSDTADGMPYDPSGTMTRARNMWSPSSVQPMLEYYLGKPLPEIGNRISGVRARDRLPAVQQAMGCGAALSERGTMIRRTSYFAGRVQGVGFRYTAKSIARGFKVVGYVRSLPDRRVELAAEGEIDEIERFLQQIHEKMSGFIKTHLHDDSPATGEFSAFEVRR